MIFVVPATRSGGNSFRATLDAKEMKLKTKGLKLTDAELKDELDHEL